MWLEVAARKANIPYLEYACMPIGELSDFADFFHASEGDADVQKRISDEFIPEVM